MKRQVALVALTLGMVSIAHAETQTNVEDAPQNPLATPWSRPQPTYRFIDPGLAPQIGDGNAVAAVANNVIYLNNCKPNGCQVTPGNENSAQNRSTIPEQASTVQAFAYSDAVWNSIVTCVRETYAPFNVQIVTERPTTPGYHMAIVAGRPQDVQMEQGVGGVSPFSCGYINGGISYSFANIYGGDIDETCWTVAQETAHSWGLDHKYDNKDPMTYLQSGPTRKTFQNTAGSCGEYSARQCQCTYEGGKLNSFKEVMETFGPSGPPTPPTVKITAPANNETVATSFPVRADIMDDFGASKAELYIDGAKIATLSAAPWVFNAPATLAQGNHTVKVIGYDVAGTPGEASVRVTLGAACTGDVCANGTDACVDGRCVPGQGVDGGLGSACVANADCKSGQCASDGTNSYCVEACDVAVDGCPGDFGCIPNGAGGVCWPGAGEGGGCQTTDSNGPAPTGAIFFGLGLGALLITRRRRS